jgi:hypothetical protein
MEYSQYRQYNKIKKRKLENLFLSNFVTKLLNIYSSEFKYLCAIILHSILDISDFIFFPYKVREIVLDLDQYFFP